MRFLYNVFNPSGASLFKPALPPTVAICMECLEPETQELFLSPVFHSLGVLLTSRKSLGHIFAEDTWITFLKAEVRGDTVISFPRCSGDTHGTKPEWMAQPGFVHVYILGPVTRRMK